MNEEGPLVETLTRRLADCPADFLAEPLDKSGKGAAAVEAVVYDLIRDLGGPPLTRAESAIFALKKNLSKAERNRLRVVLVACWLLHDPWFRYRRKFAREAFALVRTGLDEVAALVKAERFVSDPDRREEMARLCLKALGLRPAGETATQSEDRLATLDSAERTRVIRAARAAEERARRVREEMARKAAEEAAATYGRE
jgi:hypothetical protein